MKKRLLGLLLTTCMTASLLSGCGKKVENTSGENTSSGDGTKKEEAVNLTWYQIGGEQKDAQKVIDKFNEYSAEKIGVTVDIKYVGWGDYNQKMNLQINTGGNWDLCFTCSWSNDYVQNAQRGAFLALDSLLDEYGKDLKETINPTFMDAAKIGGVTYAIPNEKEVGSMPMWVFTKEYVDKYNIPYQDIKTMEDLEPWLKLIHENEPDVVPFYVNKNFTVPLYMDVITSPVGIEYGDDSLTVKNLYETDKMKSSLETMRKYYLAGYVNQDAATCDDDKSVKRFVTKGDGQPYAENVWSADLGYDVVATPIMDTVVTNGSARGSMTAVNKLTKHPEAAVKLLNFLATDTYARNLLNYGIEGDHYELVDATPEELEAAKGKEHVFDKKVHYTENKENYSVPTWVQGGLFNTYVTEIDPIDKWSVFDEFNKSAVKGPVFGFDVNLEPVSIQVSSFQNVLDEFGKALNTGSVDPTEYLEKMNKKLADCGIDKVIKEIQSQVDAWKVTK